MPLGTLVQIDEKIATTDEIQVREGWVPRHVVTREHTIFPDDFADLVTVFDFREESPEPPRLDVLLDSDRIDAMNDALFSVRDDLTLPISRPVEQQ